jgi:hypothetical protein
MGDDQLEKRLWKLKETQGKTAPNYCHAASKFMALKLIGAVQESKHMKDHVNSEWGKQAAKGSKKGLGHKWGVAIETQTEMYNKVFLPGAVANPDGGVMTGTAPTDIEFHFFSNDVASADMLLTGRTPLLVGVGINGGRAREHWVTMFKDKDGIPWVIDPWGGDYKDGVFPLKKTFSFSKPVTIKSDLSDRIPSSPPMFGYFRSKKTGALSVSLGF